MPHFSLVPFTLDPLVSALVLTGTVDRDGPVLRAEYRLSGAVSALVIPGPALEPARRDGLWRTTCFELFAAPAAQAQYLEVNLSPGGDWNAYSFTGYRDGMAPLAVTRFTPRLSGPGSRPDALELGFALELGPDSRLEPRLDVAVTAVLEHESGIRSYWALTHTGDRPDFHRRDSFILRL